MEKRPFVLSGGGARGFAHLGAIKALSEKGIEPAAISGASAGAIAGAFLASGYTPDEIKAIFISNIKFNLLSWNSLKLGLISTKNIREFLEKHLLYKNIEDLHFPFFATASSFIDGSQKIFDKGNLIEILIASSSIPVMFPPVFIEGVPYVDGGLSNNLPIEPLSDRKAETICIHVNPLKPFSPEEGVLEVLDRTLHLSFRKRVNESAENCHLLIEPNPLCKFGVFDLHKVEEIFEIGYSFTRALLEQGE